MATFGETRAGDQANNSRIDNQIQLTRYSSTAALAETGTISKLTAWVSVDTANQVTRVKGAIYTSLLALIDGTQTHEIDIQAANTNVRAVDFALLTPKELTAGTYILALWGEEGTGGTWPRLHYYGSLTGGANSNATNVSTYTAGEGDWVTPLEAGAFSGSPFSIYATYTTGGGASTTPAKMDTYRRRG
jgi:hypothetical protein